MSRRKLEAGPLVGGPRAGRHASLAAAKMGLPGQQRRHSGRDTRSCGMKVNRTCKAPARSF